MDAAQPLAYVFGAGNDVVDLPPGVVFSDLRFRRDRAHLHLVTSQGLTITVRDFFAVPAMPILRAADGDTLRGNAIDVLVSLSNRAVAVLMGAPRDPSLMACASAHPVG